MEHQEFQVLMVQGASGVNGLNGSGNIRNFESNGPLVQVVHNGLRWNIRNSRC
jgi:hypothetical protein